MHLLTSTDDTGHGARKQADIVELLVDARVGILGLVEEARPEAGAPNFFHFRGRAANTAAFTRQTNFARSAGASVRREVAASKAIGEAIERYCAAIFDVEELPLVAYREAPFPCIAPHEFALYSREQYDSPDFPWSPFDKDTRIRWTAATDLATGVPCYVPASRVYMPYLYYIDTGDVPIDQPISTGLACQMSSAEAIRAAISEVVERDAFLITWQAMLAPPRIRLETLSVANRTWSAASNVRAVAWSFSTLRWITESRRSCPCCWATRLGRRPWSWPPRQRSIPSMPSAAAWKSWR